MPLFEHKTINLEDGNWVRIRELSVGELREADMKGTERLAEIIKMLPEGIVERQMQQQRDQAIERMTRFDGYDPETLLKYGIVEWSFDEPCTPENRVRLPARIGEMVAREIFSLSVLSAGESQDSSASFGADVSTSDSPAPTTSIGPADS